MHRHPMSKAQMVESMSLILQGGHHHQEVSREKIGQGHLAMSGLSYTNQFHLDIVPNSAPKNKPRGILVVLFQIQIGNMFF